MFSVVLILYFVALGGAQQVLNATALGLLGPLLTQWRWSNNQGCMGEIYQPIVLVPGCNPGVQMTASNTLPFSYTSAQQRSTYLSNCTGQSPFHFCNVTYYNTSRTCAGDIAAEFTAATGQCSAVAPNSFIFQYRNFSTVPDTSFVIVARHDNRDCTDYAEYNYCGSYDEDGYYVEDPDCEPPEDDTTYIFYRRHPYGSCQSNSGDSYRLLSCQAPSGRPIVDMTYWIGNDACEGEPTHVIEGRSPACLIDQPINGQSMTFHCSVGSFVGASASLFITLLAGLLL